MRATARSPAQTEPNNRRAPPPAPPQGRRLQEALALQDQLREQNSGVARDNSALRAKLTHAFALVKTYQHKVGAPGGRGPRAALGGWAAGGAAGRVGGGRCGWAGRGLCGGAPMLPSITHCTPNVTPLPQVRTLHAALQAGPAGPPADTLLGALPPELGELGGAAEAGGRESGAAPELSPIREGGPEGPCPSRGCSSCASSGGSGSGGGGGGPSLAATGPAAFEGQAGTLTGRQPPPVPLSLQPPQLPELGYHQQPALPQPLQQQLEPLALLARALLEAQADMLAARQGGGASCAHQQPRKQQQHQQQQEAAAPSRAAEAEAGKENAPPAGGGPAGPALAASPAPCPAEPQFIVSTAGNAPGAARFGSGVGSAASPPHPAHGFLAGQGQLEASPLAPSKEPAAGPVAVAAATAAAAQEQAALGPRGGGLSGLDPSLLEVVAEVEGMLGSAAAPQRPGSRGGQPCSTPWGGLYEESDLLSIIAALE